MLKTNVYDMSGKLVGEIELSEAVFGIEPNAAVGQMILDGIMDNCCIGGNAEYGLGELDLTDDLAGHIQNIRLKHCSSSPFLSLLRKPSGDFCRKPSAGSC